MTNEEIERLKDASQYTVNVGGDEIGVDPRKILGLVQKLQEAAARIEQLETTLQETIKLMTEASREAGHWKGKYEAAGYPGTLDGWIEKAKALEAENARLRRALLACEPFVHHFKGGWSGHTPGDISTSELLATIRAALAGKAGT